MRLFFTLLPQRTNWHQKAADPAEFIIDETFGVPGVGTVVAGTIPLLHHKRWPCSAHEEWHTHLDGSGIPRRRADKILARAM